ncbi:MAG: glycosyltransferase family 4 protein [Verrucomicrobiota bacterium]|jgi:glycosyltransferase involved in cell wall biosynthesis
MKKIKIAFVVTDNREHERCYTETMPRFAAGATSLFQGLLLLEDVEVHILSCAQRPMASSPEKLGRNIWYHSLHVPKIGWLRTFYQGCIRAVRKKLKEIRPDIVHGWGTERECALSAVLSGFPNVVTIQGNLAELARMARPRIGSYLWLATRLENFTLPRTQGVFCNSTYTENLVRPRARKTWLVPHALRNAFSEPVPETTRPCVLLNAGVIDPRKRQLELLDVAEALYRRGLKCEFRFIGFTLAANPYAAAFLERIKPLEAKGCARFLGAQPENQLVGVFDAVAGMVHFPTEEAFGNVVAEALARNLKFFGSRVGGIVDIAQGAPGAELLASDDWAGLTDAIARWIVQGHPRPDEAAAVMRQRYQPEAVARRHVVIYGEVLNFAARK